MNPTTPTADTSETGKIKRPPGRTRVNPTNSDEPNDLQGGPERDQRLKMNRTAPMADTSELNDPE